MIVTWAAVMGGANMIYHGCGWLEGGLTASFEKFIIDAEIMQMMALFLEPRGLVLRTWGWKPCTTWAEDGSVDATHRAHRIYKRLVEEYEQPPLDEGISQELEAFVARRVEEGRVPVN